MSSVEKRKEYQKKYREENKEHISELKKTVYWKRKELDPSFHCSQRGRKRTETWKQHTK